MKTTKLSTQVKHYRNIITLDKLTEELSYDPTTMVILPSLGHRFHLSNWWKLENIEHVTTLFIIGGGVRLNGITIKPAENPAPYLRHLTAEVYATHYKAKTPPAKIILDIIYEEWLTESDQPSNRVVFNNINRYLKSENYRINQERYKPSRLLADAIEPILAEERGDFFRKNQSKEELYTVPQLREQLKLLEITTKEFMTAPAQVTPRFSPLIIPERIFREGQAPSWVFDSTKTASSHTQEIEARIVNAWYAKQNDPAFHIPTMDEQERELQDLREWFQTLRLQQWARPTKLTEEDVAKYVRLQELEDKVGYYLNPEWVEDPTIEEEENYNEEN